MADKETEKGITIEEFKTELSGIMTPDSNIKNIVDIIKENRD